MSMQGLPDIDRSVATRRVPFIEESPVVAATTSDLEGWFAMFAMAREWKDSDV